eukprot:1147274-Pelagomonas_calceolata.AAC.4
MFCTAVACQSYITTANLPTTSEIPGSRRMELPQGHQLHRTLPAAHVIHLQEYPGTHSGVGGSLETSVA